MASTIDHLTSQTILDKRTFEILVVDDGSTDGTSAAAIRLAAQYPKCNIRVVTLEKNLGKGGAVRHGMLYASGERLLMADADGASRIEDLELLWKAMDALVPDNGSAVVVGSRAHLVKSEAVVKVRRSEPFSKVVKMFKHWNFSAPSYATSSCTVYTRYCELWVSATFVIHSAASSCFHVRRHSRYFPPNISLPGYLMWSSCS